MAINLQSLSFTPQHKNSTSADRFNSEGYLDKYPQAGYDGFTQLGVNALDSNWIIPSGKVPAANVVNDTVFNVRQYATMDAPHQVFTDKEIIERQTRFNNLKRVEVPAGTARMTNLFRSHSNLQEVVLPDSCTEIMDEAFYNCNKLEKINLENVTSIGIRAFDSCRKLSDISNIDNITSLGANAFNYCTMLTSITIPSSITKIPSNCFNHCELLETVNLPNTLTEILSSAFSNTAIKNITLPDTLTKIESNAFYWCKSLESIVIPSNTGGYLSSAFSGCTSLKSVIFDNNDVITRFSNSVFNGCTELETVVLPNRLDSINSSVFQNCNKLAEITFPAVFSNLGSGNEFSITNGQPDVPLTITLPYNGIVTLSSTTFRNRTINKIRVPANKVESYKTATYWSAIADKIEAIS